nr:unnamed protein product [Spirometra erinaceieuropaei]
MPISSLLHAPAVAAAAAAASAAPDASSGCGYRLHIRHAHLGDLQWHRQGRQRRMFVPRTTYCATYMNA